MYILNRKFNGNSKNVLKTVIFLLQVSFAADFVFQTVFLAVQTLTLIFSPEYTKLYSVFSGY